MESSVRAGESDKTMNEYEIYSYETFRKRNMIVFKKNLTFLVTCLSLYNKG